MNKQKNCVDFDFCEEEEGGQLDCSSCNNYQNVADVCEDYNVHDDKCIECSISA